MGKNGARKLEKLIKDWNGKGLTQMLGPLILAAVLAASGPEVQVGTVDGGAKKGALDQITAENVLLRTHDGEVKLPIDQVLSVSSTAKPAGSHAAEPKVWIELIDDSRLNGSTLTTKDNQAELAIGDDKPLALPVSAIRCVRFSRPDDPASPKWPIIGGEPATDLLAVRKKDAIDFMEGTVVGMTADQVMFRVDGETIPVKRAKVDGFTLAHKSADKLPAQIAVIEDAAGWHLNARSLALSDGQLKIKTPAGQEFTRPIDQLVRIDFSSGKITYLSDLDPQSVAWTPYFDLADASPGLAAYYAPRRDGGRENQPIRLGGKTFTKGLSLYSRTTLVYRLPPGMKTFRALAGIDDSVRPGGNVQLVISADDRKLFDQIIKGTDAPVDINLDVAGAKRLSILVDFGDDDDAGDYLNLAEARTLK
jgi:NPCBM/NEW2 domain